MRSSFDDLGSCSNKVVISVRHCWVYVQIFSENSLSTTIFIGFKCRLEQGNIVP